MPKNCPGRWMMLFGLCIGINWMPECRFFIADPVQNRFKRFPAVARVIVVCSEKFVFARHESHPLVAPLCIHSMNFEPIRIGSTLVEMQDRSPKLFLSYSSNDRPAAERIVMHLREQGFDVWIDQSGIAPAANWSHAIAEALERCSIFLLLLSPSSLASKNVLKELSLAAESDKHIIPIEMEPMIALPTAF